MFAESVLPFWAVAALYALTLVLYIRWFITPSPRFGSLASGALIASALIHVIYLALLGSIRGIWPPINSGETLSLLSLSNAIIYAYVEWRAGEKGMGFIALLTITFFAIAAALIGPAREIPEILLQHGSGFHAPIFILAFTAFTMSAFMSVGYLMQYSQLRRKKPGLLMLRLPALQMLDLITRRATRIGVFFLTLGLIFGVAHAHKAWGRGWSWDPKQCTTLTTLILYCIVLLLRRWRSWGGQRVAVVNLVAYGSMLLGIFLLLLAFDSQHQFK